MSMNKHSQGVNKVSKGSIAQGFVSEKQETARPVIYNNFCQMAYANFQFILLNTLIEICISVRIKLLGNKSIYSLFRISKII